LTTDGAWLTEPVTLGKFRSVDIQASRSARDVERELSFDRHERIAHRVEAAGPQLSERPCPVPALV
jgi:hypothetical protein